MLASDLAFHVGGPCCDFAVLRTKLDQIAVVQGKVDHAGSGRIEQRVGSDDCRYPAATTLLNAIKPTLGFGGCDLSIGQLDFQVGSLIQPALVAAAALQVVGGLEVLQRPV